MFRLDDEIRAWREDLEDRGWFSPRQLNELEDHLRAHAARELQSAPGTDPARALRTTAREELGEPTALFREFRRSRAPSWRPLLLAGWGLYALSFLLPGFGAVGFGPSGAGLGMSAPGYEFLGLALENGWILPLLLNLPMVLALAALGRARRSMDRSLLLVTGAAGASALGFGVFNLLSPLTLPVDGDRFMYGHLGTAYWVWAASFALVAVSLWLRDREWAPARPEESVA
ncbi:hypothetical protein [Candidatus Palauibacter sp.]|uniref:hypothetical protein n=1 Tax=Candidatus Palauibacter sp. TaxID=3101350 RepID=UPI003D09E8BB